VPPRNGGHFLFLQVQAKKIEPDKHSPTAATVLFSEGAHPDIAGVQCQLLFIQSPKETFNDCRVYMVRDVDFFL
jgi:hypothetical protein